MAKIYYVKWKTLDIDKDTGDISGEKFIEYAFNDIKFDDFVIRATNDENNYRVIIPYTSIYDIEIEGKDDIEEPYMGH